MSNPFNTGLDRNPANYQPLTPIGFLERAAQAFPDHTAIVHGGLRRSYGAFYDRSRQLASALAQWGIARGQTVSVLLANTPAMLECHYGVPMCGAVLHAINTRLDAAIIAFQLDHALSRLVIVDVEFLPLLQDALALCKTPPAVIVYDDPEFDGPRVTTDTPDYEAFVAAGDSEFAWLQPQDEWDAIAISYTSGTTGDPKGVVTHHRGAYLLAQGNALTASMAKHAVYLWTLPMFHCNGWCFPWTLSAIVGTHVCLRQIRAEPIWQALGSEGVTHLCGAPIVMSLMIQAPETVKCPLDTPVQFFTAAAPPPEKLLAEMKEAGFDVTHLYGLTETYGPAVVNDWHVDWSDLPPEEQARLKARQGVRYLPLEGLDVLDPETMQPVPRDGKTIGEVMFRGNVVMKGYFRNPAATAEAFAGGWFHSGDLGVVYPDGYIQLKDRSKDVIISGGENISSIEIEEVLYRHPAVAVTAVVAMPHDKWGETPCAYVELAEGQEASAEALRAWCREHLAHYKVPGRFVFRVIPRTSTGKIQKFALRNQLRAPEDA
ncbi:acyl-CoA synthetase [Donghicola sp.]|jgi:fatty-acyl-CoA synthase|uniref:acyl-CoA synthetase n=1 Tax=Donghicola sp. TaxID=1929294 RepID=UPI0025D8D0A2|nr:acyl-CoA synthetase [Donghicola sp.]MCT4577529.1 acyl-CoA synthetase [Donghicola sp.]